jgi:hypothetical protein
MNYGHTRAKVLPHALRRLRIREANFKAAEMTGDPTAILRERRRLEASRTEVELCTTPQALSTPGSAISLPRGRHVA